ncbi:type 4a pilus biogenesis protein PilO [Candidatus Berkelbacteria bacterium]|nr:type 4a pilus biogenesis protein PilO [Candidatus Berkelbacteria bacterium]
MENKHSRLGIFLLILAVFGWFAFLRGQITVFGEKSLDAKARSVELESYKTRIADLKQIKEKGEQVQSTLRAMYLAMPKQNQIPEVLVMIETIGANSGIVFSGVTVGNTTANQTVPGTDASTIAEVPVTVSFNGTLTSVTKFISAINTNIRTAKVQSQTISADKSGILTVTMQLGLVYQGGGNQ